jgi:hypothetical protein
LVAKPGQRLLFVVCCLRLFERAKEMAPTEGAGASERFAEEQQLEQ